MRSLLLILNLFLSLSFVKATIILSKKHNIYDEVNDRKIHQGNVPRLGGIGLFASCIVVYTLYLIFFETPSKGIFPIFLGGFGIFIFGIIDDLRNLRARFKFLIQIIMIGAAVFFSDYYIDYIYTWKVPLVLGKLLTFFWILFLVNAFNLIDGIDWLCSGLSLFALLSVAFLFYKNNLPTFFCLSICAGILGFMYFNKPKGRIFLGDGGAQALGYIVASIPLFLPNTNNLQTNKFFIAMLLGLIPATDVIAAIWRRLRDKRSIFSTDRSHIHHKLLNIGFSMYTAIGTLLGLQLLVCITICLTQYSEGPISSLVPLAFSFVIVVSFFILIHYINRGVNRKYKGHLAENAQEEH